MKIKDLMYVENIHVKANETLNEDESPTVSRYDEMLNYIRQNCKPYLEKFPKDKPLYRADNTNADYIIRTTREDREPKSGTFSTPEFKKNFEKLLIEQNHNPRDKKTVFVMSGMDPSVLKMHGGNVFYVIPIGEFSITYDKTSGSDFNIGNKVREPFEAISKLIMMLKYRLTKKDYEEELIERYELTDDKRYKKFIRIIESINGMLENSELFLEKNIPYLKKTIVELNDIMEVYDFSTKDDSFRIINSLKGIIRLIEHVKENFLTDDISELFTDIREAHIRCDQYIMINDSDYPFVYLMEDL